MNTATSIGEQLLKANPAEYERHILVAVNKCEAVWKKLKSKLCWDKNSRIHVNDFSNLDYYILYRAILQWRTAAEERGLDFSPISQSMLNVQLLVLSNSSTEILLTKDEVSRYVKLFNELMESISADDAEIVAQNCNKWLKSKRLKKEFEELRRSGYSSLDDSLLKITETATQLATDESENNGFVEFGDGIDSDEVLLERIPLGANLGFLNGCLGGGLGKTEHIMFFAPSGAGKTVLACQIAGEVASTDHQVLYITTEQHPSELMPRIISALGSTSMTNDIPFDAIKDGGKYTDKLTPGQYTAYTRVVTALRGKLHFYDWGGKGLTVQTDLENIIKTSLKSYHLDLVVLDWIGGALGAGITDPGVMRYTYNAAADLVKELAKKYGFAAVSFAQANADAANKAEIDQRHIAESRTMYRNAEAAFGISAIKTSESSDGQRATYSDIQYLSCFKSRKSIASSIRIRRDFARQRFMPMQ